MTRNVLLAMVTLCLGCTGLGCADIIGLSGLGNESDESSSGGAASDEGTGGDSSTGGASAGGGQPGDGGTEGDGGMASSGAAAGAGGSETGGTGSGGIGGSGGNGSGGTGGSGSGGTGGIPYACTDDMFGDLLITEGCWAVFNADLLTGGNTEGGYFWEEGVLTLRPETERGWRNGDSGFFMYQEVPGNFLMEVHANFEDTAGDPPEMADVYGGLLVVPAELDLATTPHTDYFAVKFGNLPGGQTGFRAEYATDAAGTTVSTEVTSTIAGDGVYLRVCRVGSYLWTGAKRGNASTWTALHAGGAAFYETGDSDLPPLSNTVRVGLIGEMIGTGASGSVHITYDDTEFVNYPPSDVADCGNTYFPAP